MNKIFLHIEGLAVLVLSLFIYGSNDFSWIMFLVLLLAPDLSMLGYLVNQKVGAISYNLFHTYTIPISFMILGLLVSNQTIEALSLIWIAHIGMDRMLGYGLKYETNFKDTHLNRV